MLVLKRGRWVVSKTLILIFLGIHWFIGELRVFINIFSKFYL